MRDLEQWGDAESLGEVRPQALEGVIIQEYIALNLPRNVLNCPWI
jgi:hypothetical protein